MVRAPDIRRRARDLHGRCCVARHGAGRASAEALLEPVMSVFMGPGGHAVCYYVRGGKLSTSSASSRPTSCRRNPGRVKLPWEDLKADFKGWHPIIQTVIDAADQDQCFRWSLHNRPPIRNWSTARVTLLGDSAHPTLPYLAQGAVMAIEDGAVLARALGMTRRFPMRCSFISAIGSIAPRRSSRSRVRTGGYSICRSVAEISAEFAKRDEGADRNNWLYSYNPLKVELV